MLDDLKLVKLVNLKAKDLLHYDKRVRDYLDLLIGGFHRVTEITRDKGFEASVLDLKI